MTVAEGSRRTVAAAAVVMLVSLLPFALGLLSGHSLFFRDLSGYFFPVRLFALEGLRAFELRYWSSLTLEGEPLALLPIAYPFDLLQVVAPTPAGLSLFLALHIPLAALGAFLLARHLGLGPVGASGGALAYALGGFALSSLNLYVYVQALAWAPFVIRGLGRAALGRWRDVAAAALFVGVAVTTTGIEIVAQAFLVGLLLARPWNRGALVRTSLSLALGFGLSAAVALPVSALVAQSARGRGFTTEVVLAHSVHPITMLQTVIAGLYGDTARLTDTFWGQNYFPRGFPYFPSLYLGALVLGLAFLGSRPKPEPGRLLAGLALLALVISLGRYAGLTTVIDAVPVLRRFRFPSKAFFTVHLAVALLVGLALDALTREAGSRSWKRASMLLCALGLIVAIGPWLALRPLGLRRYLLAGFFPPDFDVASRVRAAGAISIDAMTGGAVALGGALVAYAASRGWLPVRRAAWLLVAILASDLLRAGAGLNPMVSPAFFRPSPEASRMAEIVRAAGGRLFTFDPGYSPAYFAARARHRGEHEVWSFAVMQEALVPHFNLALSVPTALGLDQTMLAPEERILSPESAEPRALARIVERLREAAVSHVLAVEPLSHPDLELILELAPDRIAPLHLRLYSLHGARPRFEIKGEGRVLSAREAGDRLQVEAEAMGPATLVVRDGWAPGWSVRVDGSVRPLERTADGHRATVLERGRHVVDFAYRPPGLFLGLAITLASALVVIGLLLARAGDPEPLPSRV